MKVIIIVIIKNENSVSDCLVDFFSKCTTKKNINKQNYHYFGFKAHDKRGKSKKYNKIWLLCINFFFAMKFFVCSHKWYEIGRILFCVCVFGKRRGRKLIELQKVSVFYFRFTSDVCVCVCVWLSHFETTTIIITTIANNKFTLCIITVYNPLYVCCCCCCW
mgnify:CR=1 FL=1